MGLDTVVVAFFVVGTILVVAGSITMGANNLIETSYKGYVSASQTTLERLHTNIEIQDISYDGGAKHIHFTVKNTGETKLNDFELWDVIVVKNGHASYLSDYEYNISFTNDFLNPGIFDPHENIDIELLTEFNSSENVFIKISTENGIISSAQYVVGE
ncbi:MAG TPA: flagellar protein FlaF [Methanosarcina sp.]|nr:flagellar protein FlaF [Methanosarcina sp.]